MQARSALARFRALSPRARYALPAALVTLVAAGAIGFGTTRDAPYLIAGLGAYNRSSGSSAFGYNGRTAVGINGGAGLRFPLSGLSTFFEARYHLMLGSAAEGTDYQFIPITFGISF